MSSLYSEDVTGIPDGSTIASLTDARLRRIVGLTVGHRLRRWATIKPTMVQRLAGIFRVGIRDPDANSFSAETDFRRQILT